MIFFIKTMKIKTNITKENVCIIVEFYIFTNVQKFGVNTIIF